ncbi:uncharacterized protein LOC135694024 isoform X2 [Rhopilema esculentum]|uniref:uncharacterized protein LOC135694024 isoform X2 n=1 Tax=Rhopilema esculentum TaxID=499914 RepID=UPI0031D6EC48
MVKVSINGMPNLRIFSFLGGKDNSRFSLSNQKEGQIKRTNSCRIVSGINKSTDLLDLMTDLSTSKEIGTRLSTSQSCLALNEIAKIKEINFIDKPSFSKDVFYNKRNMLIRKDSGTESGFVESEAEFENEASRQVPDSFDLLPPLEKRRQIRIRELVQLADTFANGFSTSLQKLELAVKRNFPRSIMISLARKIDKMEKIEKILFKLTRELSKKKLLFSQQWTSKSEDEFYIDVVGNLFSSKMKDVLVAYGEMREIRNEYDDGSEQFHEFRLLHEDAVDVLAEYFLRLQLALKYVLYCTPRQHIDHRCLTNIVEDLNHFNRCKFQKESKCEKEKGLSDDWPSPDGEAQPENESHNSKDETERKAKLVKRRHSCDNSTLKKLSSFTRGIGFLRSSGRRSRQEGETPLKRTQLIDSSDMRAKPRKSGSAIPWHSTPKESRATHNGKENGVLEDRETSFDSNFYLFNEKQSIDSFHTKGGIVPHENISSSNDTITDDSNELEKSGDLSNHKGQARTAGRDEKVNGKVPPLDTRFDCSHKRDHYRARMNSLGRSKGSSIAKSLKENTECCSNESLGYQSEKAIDRSRESASSKDRIFDVFYNNGTVDVPDPIKKSSIGERPSILPVPRSPSSSPTILPDFSPQSPSLLERSENLFPLSCDQVTEKNSSASFTRPSSKLEKQEKCRKKKEKSEKLLVPVPFPDSYTSDEDMRLDRYIGESCMKSVPKMSHSGKSNSTLDGTSSRIDRCHARHFEKLNENCSDEKIKSHQAAEAHAKCRKVSHDKSVLGKNSKKLSSDSRSDLPPLEDSSKGIKVSISRAKKSFLDFTSPIISRKKERTLKNSNNLTLQSCDGITTAAKKETSSSNSKKFNKSYTADGWLNDLKERTLNGHCKNCQEARPVSHFDRYSYECGTSTSPFGNREPSSFLCSKNELPGSSKSCHLNDSLLDDQIEESHGQSSPECVQRCRSPSLTSNLSISSDFNITVTRFLRSNRESSTETVVGNSTFYRASPEVPARSPDLELSVEQREVHQKASRPIESSPAIANSRSLNDHDSNFLTRTKLDNQNGNKIAATRVKSNNAQETTTPQNSDLAAIRISKSDPVLKYSTTQSTLKNARDNSQLIANESLDTQKILEKLRKVPKARVLSWAESFDNLLSDKDGVKLFGHFLKSEFSEENLLFWLACQQFKSIRSSKIAKEAQKIYGMFIEICAIYEVNLDHQTRTTIKDSVQSPSKNIFDAAQSKIRLLMAQDSYPRFIRSRTYKDLAE